MICNRRLLSAKCCFFLKTREGFVNKKDLEDKKIQPERVGLYMSYLPRPPIAVNGLEAARVLGHAGAVAAPAAGTARRPVRPRHVLRPAALLLATRRRAPQTLARRLQFKARMSVP